MNRTQLEHIFRAANQISGDAEIVVVGSQAIDAQPMKLPPIAFQSDEADVIRATITSAPRRSTRRSASFRRSMTRTAITATALARPLPFSRAFNRELARHGVLSKRRLTRLVPSMPIDDEHKRLILARIKADFATPTPRSGPELLRS